jgi:hypothetical protein
MKLEKLKVPITPRWRVQSTKNGKAICVPYIDARQAQERFDEVCTPEKWQNSYDAENGVAGIAIFIDNDWIWKTDVGTESNVEKVKGKASDAFKRAAVLWGVGRDLYKKGTKVLDADGNLAVTGQGTKLWTGDQLSNYINGLSESKAMLAQIWSANKDLQGNEEFKAAMSKLKSLV